MTFAFPADSTEDRAKRWLLDLVAGSERELAAHPDLALAAVVKEFFSRSSQDVRERIKSGILLALQEWQYSAQRYLALQHLSEFAAVVRATAAIPILAEIIRRECAAGREDESRASALSAAAACLRGFAPAVDLDMWLRILLYDPHLDPSLAGLIFVGLCKGRPDSMSLHVNKFLELAETVPSKFAFIGGALLDAVPPVQLIAQFREMPSSARLALVPLLERVPSSGLSFGVEDSGVVLAWEGAPTVKVRVPSDSPAYIAKHYQKLLTAIWVGDPNAALLQGIPRH